MSIFEIIALLLSLAAIFSYLNIKTIKLPMPIGLMFFSLLIALGIMGLELLGVDIRTPATAVLSSIDFNKTLMQGMLSFLLFAGALHVNLNDLSEQKWIISALATIGLLISTALVGILSWYVLGMLGFHIDFIWCLLFGALISPTDPIAVLSILKTAGASKSLEAKIAGESLFNDGIAVVVFIVLFEIASGGETLTVGYILTLFIEEAVGGALFGLLIGYIAFLMLKDIDNYTAEILITLALVTGGYALAAVIHVSGPIAMVVSGLLIGNHGRRLAMSDKTRDHLDSFWEMIDEILNAVLFVFIGLEVLILTFDWNILLAGIILIPLILLARLISVGLPVTVLRFKRSFSPGVIKILTWGGLRGGISVALALSIPEGAVRDVLLPVTYLVVAFSILIQGTTMGKLMRSLA